MDEPSMTGTISVRVRAFAVLREALGAAELAVTLPGGADVASLLARLAEDHPGARLADRRFTTAVNKKYAPPETALADGDEVALIPPVSGGSGKLFEIIDKPISIDAVAARLSAPANGAITLFVGTVRGVTKGTSGGGAQVITDYLEYEAYPEMAEASFESIAAEAIARWPAIRAVSIVHRTGRLEVGDISVVIAVAAGHRQDTFDACHYIIDRVKQIAPIWKREVGPDGTFWVAESREVGEAESREVGGKGPGSVS
jgi:molybdopterin converting factor subunit 1